MQLVEPLDETDLPAPVEIEKTESWATIKRAYYDKDFDIVVWESLLEDGTPHTITWPAARFAEGIGVGVGRVPEKLLLEFLDNLTRQKKRFKAQRNFVKQEVASLGDESIKKAVDESMGRFTQSVFSSNNIEQWKKERGMR